MDALGVILVSLVVTSLVQGCLGRVHLFSTLPMTLNVSASPTSGQVLKAGEDQLTVNWGLINSFAYDTDYKTVTVNLCFAPISQNDDGRKTHDDLAKDKTCPYLIVTRPYTSGNNSTFQYTYTIQKEVSQAVYFIRAYVLNADDRPVGYGQTTDPHKTTNLFQVVAASSQHPPFPPNSVSRLQFYFPTTIFFVVSTLLLSTLKIIY